MPHPTHGLPAHRLRVAVALKRSRSRRRVLRFLVEQGPAYASRIAKEIGVDASATIGALRGLGARYAHSLSLTELGLVQEVEGMTGTPGVRVYEATEEGREVWRASRAEMRGGGI